MLNPLIAVCDAFFHTIFIKPSPAVASALSGFSGSSSLTVFTFTLIEGLLSFPIGSTAVT